jgi:ATP-dependent DNA helicase PIF1
MANIEYFENKLIKDILLYIKNNKSFTEIASLYNKSIIILVEQLLEIGYILIEIYDIDLEVVTKKINIGNTKILDYITLKNQNKPTSDLILEIIKINQQIEHNIDTNNTLSILEDQFNENQNINLNKKQLYAFNQFIQKKNLFITGPGGTGKSSVIKEIIKYCKLNNIEIGVTGTTGCAAILIGGKTLHSYLGIGLGTKTAKDLYLNNRYKLSHIIKKLKLIEVLIIDEISMLDLELFEKISEYLSLIRGHQNPFGNIQIILTGDFCQLEPIIGNYCFLSQVWLDLKLEIIFLNKLIRQKNDKVFQNILRELRYGICTDRTIEILKQCKKIDIDENIKPTLLYSKNIDVDKINNLEYNKLIQNNNKFMVYEIKLPEIKKNHEKIKNWIKSLDIPWMINLCVDAQIMITANINQDNEIINGTRGIIIDVLKGTVIIKTITNKLVTINYHKCIYSEDNDIYFNYMPIKLAYAISIHKSQGITLDAAEISIGKDIFAAGQAYTALSRTKNLNSIIIKDIDKQSFIIKDSVFKFYINIDPKLKKFIEKN